MLNTRLSRHLGMAIAVIGLTLAHVPPASAQLQTVQTSNGPLVIPYPQVGTDVTGIGGSLGHAQGLRRLLLGPDRNTVPSNHGVIVARDPRYDFTGAWLPLAFTQQRLAMGERTLAAVLEPPDVEPVEKVAMLSRLDNLLTRGDQDASHATAIPQMMPTGSTTYCVSGNEISLQSGALLIKVDRERPVYVSSTVDGNDVSLRVSDGAFVLVSALGGRLSVLNLADSGRDSCTLYINDRNCGAPGQLNLRVGHLAELFPTSLCRAENELVSYTVPNTIPMTNDLTLEVMRISYPRAMKRFNLLHSVSDHDLNRLLKTAAAISYCDNEAEWVGRTLQAP